MGNMTVVSILQDAWPTIKENPEQFVKNIEDGMNMPFTPAGFPIPIKSINSFAVGNHANPMMVARSWHDSRDKVFIVGHGYMADITETHDRKDKLFYLQNKGREIEAVERALHQARKDQVQLAIQALTELVTMEIGARVTESDIMRVAHKHGVFDYVTDEDKGHIIAAVKANMGG